MEFRHLPHSLYGPLRLHQCRQNAGYADEGDCEGVVVVVIDGPEYDRSNLKNVKGVKYLMGSS